MICTHSRPHGPSTLTERAQVRPSVMQYNGQSKTSFPSMQYSRSVVFYESASRCNVFLDTQEVTDSSSVEPTILFSRLVTSNRGPPRHVHRGTSRAHQSALGASYRVSTLPLNGVVRALTGICATLNPPAA